MKRLVLRSLLFVLVSSIALLAFLEPSAGAGETPSSAAPEASATETLVYYFHGNFRCKTCRTIEAYSEEAITQGFAGELASGQLAWRVVNTDEPENKHFVKDFELVTKSLVLVEYRDGEVVRFENLKLVWQLVRDKDGFLKYVRNATRKFIGES
jgi:hypothetical protein